MQLEKYELLHSDSTANKEDAVKCLDEEMVTVMKSIEKEKFEKDMKHLEALSYKGKSAAEFGLRSMILGKKSVHKSKLF